MDGHFGEVGCSGEGALCHTPITTQFSSCIPPPPPPESHNQDMSCCIPLNDLLCSLITRGLTAEVWEGMAPHTNMSSCPPVLELQATTRTCTAFPPPHLRSTPQPDYERRLGACARLTAEVQYRMPSPTPPAPSLYSFPLTLT